MTLFLKKVKRKRRIELGARPVEELSHCSTEVAPTPSMARPIPQETKAARRTRFRRGRTRSDKRPPLPPGDDRNEDGDDVWLLLDGL